MKEGLLKTRTKTFDDYIASLHITKEYKAYLTDKHLKDANPEYYQSYPELFSDYFDVDPDVIGQLNHAGYLFYLSVLKLDGLIDDRRIDYLPLVLTCQEESLKILATIFGLENEFWKLWNQRKMEYFVANQNEKKLSSLLEVNEDDFINLADGKSCFGKVAIDCLYALNKENKEIYERLLTSHAYFSAAFQINDDIQDIKEDYLKGQFNYAVYTLKSHEIKLDDIEKAEKLMYIRGISKSLYVLGIQYCEKALSEIDQLGPSKWRDTILRTKKTFETAITEADNYLYKLRAEVLLSRTKNTNNTLEMAISKGIEFIESQQDQNGCWKEYINQGGLSTYWATGFILSKLSSSARLKNSMNISVGKALSYLQSNEALSVSYNETWIEDCDSTTFTMLSFILNDIAISEARINRWLDYQHPNGGFSTYHNEIYLKSSLQDRNLTDVKGWLQPHYCVSSVALFLMTLSDNIGKNEKNRLITFLHTEKANSYWWIDDVYSYYYLAQSYFNLGKIDKVQKIQETIRTKINSRGAFITEKYGENIFVTGLALDIFLLNNPDLTTIENVKNYLLENQYEDGSWDNSSALQVPDPNFLFVNETVFPVSEMGVDVRAKEFNRLFTTATVLKALDNYERKFNPTII